MAKKIKPEPLSQREQELLDELSYKEEETRLSDLKQALDTRPGRRQMWHLLDITGVFKQAYTGDQETFFREGQRDIGLYYLSLIIEHMPEKFILMLQDQIDLRARREAMQHAARAEESNDRNESGVPIYFEQNAHC